MRVQQTRMTSRHVRDPKDKQLPAIYLDRLGPRRAVTRFKWFISTIIVAVAGLAVIGIVMYASMSMEKTGSVYDTLRNASFDALKPKAKGTIAADKPVAIGLKTSKLVISSKGLATKNIIYDQVMERRNNRDFMQKKSYVRLVSTLASEKPDDDSAIPPFNAQDLLGNEKPVTAKDPNANTGDATSDPRVSVRFQDVAGGFLPREDNQELSNDEAERLVSEADSLYAESEASLTDAAEEAGVDKTEAAPLQKEKNTTILYKKVDEDAPDEGFDNHYITARGGESLDAVIKAAGVDTGQATQVTEAVVKITKTKKLRAGEEVRLALMPSAADEGALDVMKISVFYQSLHILTIAKNAEGFAPNAKPVPEEKTIDDGDGERASVYLSTYRVGQSQDLPADFITKFLKIHAYDVDFKLRVKSGDTIEMFYDTVEDNGVERPSELLYAAITINGETRGYYRYRTPDGAIDYYDDKGSNSKKFLMRMPVKAARLTSGFGYRKHPLYGILKLHTGIDWAGPVGTPIYASGSGTVELAERHGGYGNYVRIRHANGYKTAYGHMLRFAEGIARGTKVRQGQTIGYIGSTGASTGAHLHYEVLLNSRFMNPLSIKIPRSRQLQGRLLTEFRKEKTRLDDLMHRPPVKTRVAAIEK